MDVTTALGGLIDKAQSHKSEDSSVDKDQEPVLETFPDDAWGLLSKSTELSEASEISVDQKNSRLRKSKQIHSPNIQSEIRKQTSWIRKNIKLYNVYFENALKLCFNSVLFEILVSIIVFIIFFWFNPCKLHDIFFDK